MGQRLLENLTEMRNHCNYREKKKQNRKKEKEKKKTEKKKPMEKYFQLRINNNNKKIRTNFKSQCDTLNLAELVSFSGKPGVTKHLSQGLL